VAKICGRREQQNKNQPTYIHIMIPLLAEITAGISGNFTLAVAGAGAAIGIGMIGMKAVEAVGRNPGASGKVLTLSIIGMALAEAIAIYALLTVFLGN